jgi:cbb3-type cytochrome c oxidase subunit II
MKYHERFSGVLVLAAFCYFLSMSVIVLAPLVLTNAGEDYVTDIHGNRVKVPAYTEHEMSGKHVYENQVCWHCHSQFVRPVMDETWRFGPVSQPGESAIDVPHLFGTRRIGPDLAREGWQRIDDWHMAHLYDPRSTVPLSVMPGFTWLFGENPVHEEVTKLIADLDSDGDGVVHQNPNFEDQAHWPADAIQGLKSTRLDNAGLEAPEAWQKEDGSDIRKGPNGEAPTYVDRWSGLPTGDGLLSDYDARPVPTDRAKDVVQYLQRLGTAIGPWMTPIDAGTPFRTNRPPMVGVTVTWKDADGNPRESSVPDDQIPQRNYEARRYGLALRNATEQEKKATETARLEYEAVMKAWLEKNPAWGERLARGKELFTTHCVACHGPEGRGNGPGAQFFLIRPRDFTSATYRYRSTASGKMPLDGDLFRSIYRGLWGTAMPSWRTLPEYQLWLLVDYVKSLAERHAGNSPLFDQQRYAIDLPPVPMIKNEKDWETRVQRGRAVWFSMQCFECHGSEGRGDGPGWAKVKPDGGLLRPRDLKKRDDRDIPTLRLRGGAAPQDLYRTIMTGLDGTQMKGSAPDFEQAWKLADALDEKVAAKAPDAEVESARKGARLKLMVRTGEGLPGVVEDKDPTGQPAEFLERVNKDDDWNLIFYVMHLLGEKPQIGR